MMKAISIFNDVLGPVMRGPSSSHTAASFHIGTLARALLGDEPLSATFRFDPDGSYAQVYRQQGSHLAFAAGLMGWTITDERFLQALELARGQRLTIRFLIEPLPYADHPNSVEIQLTSRRGKTLRAVAKSVGGGAVVFSQLGGWSVHLTGDAYEALIACEPSAEPAVRRILSWDGKVIGTPARQTNTGQVLVHARRVSPLDEDLRAELESMPGVLNIWTVTPVFFLQCGEALFAGAAEMVALAEERGCSLGEIALAYESTLLGIGERQVLDEVQRRYEVMQAAVHRGLADDDLPLRTLRPSARQIYQAEAAGEVAIGGMHTRAAARAMAVMHVNSRHGVVCAAPTAGAAGVLPAIAVTLSEELGLNPNQIARSLLAASAVGVVLGTRATFAAEIAGCQVEIGAAGAMASAAVVEAAGGTALQAVDAAAIAFQNTMGSICDPVQGVVEIPCHTRNAAAASGAFVCADLILGGYCNPIPLDDTIDAVLAVGQMLPRELKCTALGGLSTTPSALAIAPLRACEVSPIPGQGKDPT
jgi:L-serine dehydratase